MTDKQVLDKLMTKIKESKITHFSSEELWMNDFYCATSRKGGKDWVFVRGKTDKLIFYNKNRFRFAIVLMDDGSITNNRA